MNIRSFIDRVRDAGGVVMLGSNGQVQCNGNPAVMTPEVRAAVERQTDAFRVFLDKERAATLASTTARSPGSCERCGRVVWFGQGAERLPDGTLICGDCLAPWDVDAGSVPVADTDGSVQGTDRSPPGKVLPRGDAGRRCRVAGSISSGDR